MASADDDTPYAEERNDLNKKMNSLLRHMKSVKTIDEANDELEVDEEPTEGIRIHNLKSLLIGFMKTKEKSFYKDEKNKDIIAPFHNICQVCYLFYWGLYPSLYVLNGSGEDGDEYHCNGVLVINLTDGRFNYLNIYDAQNPSKIKTLEEDWDKHECGVCIVESMTLPKQILDIYNTKKIFEPNIKYNYIFRCGGKSIETLTASTEFTVIIFKNDSKLLTKVDDQITKQLQECSYDTDIIIDSLNGYQVTLPAINLPELELDDDEKMDPNELTRCNLVWSDKYGLIAIFMGNFIFHFDWFDTFEWKEISKGYHSPELNNGVYNWICLITKQQDDDDDEKKREYGNEESLFVTGTTFTAAENNTKIYSFKNKTWKTVDDRDNEFTVTSSCYDRNRNRIYCGCMKEQGAFMVNCYDVGKDEWNEDLFPAYPNVDFGNTVTEAMVGLLFMDKLFGDRLYCACGNVYYIDLDGDKGDTESSNDDDDDKKERKWRKCEDMQFIDALRDSPMHSESTFEKFICQV